MKLEIVNRRNAVEIRQLNDDGTMTIYLCENAQAALFKIANLVYSIEEPKEEAKRSILVGTFGEKKTPDRPNLEDLAKSIVADMKKQGKYTPQYIPPEQPPPAGFGQLVPSTTIGPYAGGNVKIYPADVVLTPEIDVTFGEATVNCTGSDPDGETVNLSAILASIQGNQGCFGIQDKPILMDNMGDMKMFKTTLSSNK